MDIYTIRSSYTNIDTLEELDASRLPIVVRHQGLINDVFGTENENTILGHLKERLRVSKSTNTNKEITEKGKMANFLRLAEIELTQAKFVRMDDGMSLLHMVKECPRSYTLAYVFPKASPILDTVNYYLGLFSQSGLLVKWEKATNHIIQMHKAQKLRGFVKQNRVRLKMTHLQWPFVFLICGLILSFLVLLTEIFSHKNFIKNKKNKNTRKFRRRVEKGLLPKKVKK